MPNDDHQVGRLLSRRDALILLGAAGAAGAAGLALRPAHGALGRSEGARLAGEHRGVGAGREHAVPACVARPEQIEGPYFLDEMLERSDIRSDPTDGSVKDGVPLDLTFEVSRIGPDGCQPLADALVDVWQCDALGVYSGFRDFNQEFDTVGQKFLRGYQVTGEEGTARFTTIYPGWYRGRAVHVHFKVRTAPSGGQAREFTSQLYFDDAINAQVLARPPYASPEAGRRGPIRNEQDGIFRAGGDQLLLPLERTEQGYRGTFAIGLDLS